MIEQISAGLSGICLVVAAFILKHGLPIGRNNNTINEERCKERRGNLKELLELKIDNLDKNVSELKVTVVNSTEATQDQIKTIHTTMTEILKAVKVS